MNIRMLRPRRGRRERKWFDSVKKDMVAMNVECKDAQDRPGGDGIFAEAILI